MADGCTEVFDRRRRGPTVGPLFGSAITTSYLTWRWTEYITTILIFTILVLAILLWPETYGVSVKHPIFHQIFD